MKAKKFVFIPLFLLLMCGCDKDESTTSQNCTIDFGKSSDCSFDDLDIFFQNVQESRCPTGATCVWEGEVIVDMQVNGLRATMALTPGEPLMAFDTVGGYILELRSVIPFPELDVVVNEDDIKAEIVVTKE